MAIKRKISDEEIQHYLIKKASKKLKNHNSFVWKKKIENEVAEGRLAMEDLTLKAERQRQNKRTAEIERLKKLREDRAAEKARRAEELTMLQRERVRAEIDEFTKKEDEFVLEQCKIGAKIRLREGRAKAIDVLCLKYFDDDFFDAFVEPSYKVFNGLSDDEIEEVYDGIKLHLGLNKAVAKSKDNDNDDDVVEYWEALMVVCEFELSKGRIEGGLNSSVRKDVKSLLEKKSYDELVKLEVQIEANMASGEAKVVEYWEVVLRLLGYHKAKAQLDDVHAMRMARIMRHVNKQQLPTLDVEKLEENKGGRATEEEIIAVEDDGSLSPKLLHDFEDTSGEVIDPSEDSAVLEKARVAVMKEKHMVDSKVNSWHDKYLPRKPKYLNRVHCGYEWNKYNRTHYDYDNPPPKYVQGYKFNIFYPDLIDKEKTPKFFVEKDGDSTETCIFRFRAGPPYEDIAFRIVSKDWERSTKKGFKCTFDHGILRLYFNFKRYSYRR